MCGDILAQPLALGAQHQRDLLRAHRFGQSRACLAREPDPPISRLGNLLQRARKIDDPHPRHDFQRPRCRFRQRSRFGRCVAILRHDAQRVERSCRAQDCTNIVRVGHRIEHQQCAPVVRAPVEQFTQPHIGQRLAFQHQPLMRRIVRHHPPQIGDIGIDDGQHRRQLQPPQCFARAP